ncbi:unnamed protein product [Lupinus luteus]|uniref:Uncharacterized protein n=1 Tax=Lupinus luteus TaxID=3873 RepID=A0AAV1YKN0_LUPLU
MVEPESTRSAARIRLGTTSSSSASRRVSSSLKPPAHSAITSSELFDSSLATSSTKIQMNRKKTESELEERKLKSSNSNSNSSENNSYEGSFTESLTDASESTEMASSSTSSPRTVTKVLMEWNDVRELAGAGNKGLTASGFLCCLVANRNRNRIVHLSPSER